MEAELCFITITVGFICLVYITSPGVLVSFFPQLISSFSSVVTATEVSMFICSFEQFSLDFQGFVPISTISAILTYSIILAHRTYLFSK